MRKGLFLIALLITTLSFSQERAATTTIDSAAFQKQYFVYQISKKYNDFNTARTALYNMLSMAPNNIAILDSLALIYFDFNQYTSAALISQDIVKINPNDLMANEIAAISFDNLGVFNRALPYYEKLYLENNNIGVLYRIAYLQFELKRYNEGISSVDILIENKETPNQKVIFPKNNNENQEVSMLAAAYRLKGMINMQQGNNEEAKANLSKALEIAPEFVIAQQQLDNLK